MLTLRVEKKKCYFADRPTVLNWFCLRSNSMEFGFYANSVRTKICANIRLMSQVTRRWMKTPLNQFNIKIVGWSKKMLDESLFWNKLSSNIIFHHLTCFFFSFFINFVNQSNISSNMLQLACWMKCWIGLLPPL